MKARGAIVAAALIAAFFPVSPRLVERAYSSSIYPAWQSAATRASNGVSFALLDVLIVGVSTAWLALAGYDLMHRRAGWGRAFLRVAARTITWAAALYLVFLLAWGLNYRRVRLEARLDFDASRVSPAAARALAVSDVEQLNALHDRAHRMGWPDAHAIDARLVSAFAASQREVGGAGRTVPARPKATLLDPYFRRAVVDGMTDPFFLETLVVSDLPPLERPPVVAHEWAHLAGYVDEGEANFVGWLTCMRGDEAHRYSGWLFLHNELAASLSADDRRAVDRGLLPGPRADLQAIFDRVQRNRSPRLSAAGWTAYNQYLKANRVEAGVASYAEVVRLILGTRFNPAI